MAPRLLGSLAAFAAFPVYLAMRGAPTALEVVAFAWLIAPILLSWFLSRTGRYEGAHVLSSLALAGLVMTVAMTTGGIESFAAIWLVVVPLEAALSASRRVVAFASALALACTALLIVFGHFDLLPPPDANAISRGVFMAFGVASATLYAAGPRLRRGVAGAHQRGAALCRGGPLSPAGAQHERRDFAASPQRRRAVHFARGGSDAGRRRYRGCSGTACSTASMSPIVRPISPRFRMRRAAARRAASNSACRREVPRGGARGQNAQVDFIWVEMRCRPLEQASEMAGRRAEAEVVAVMRDVTDRKLQEQALDLARTAAEQADASKTRFLATMSHELRTPLNAIIGFSEMIVQEDVLMIDAVRRKEYAQLINDSGQHLLSVVNGILDMSKMESGNFEISPEPFAPRAALINCCNLLALKARENGIDLVTRAPDDLPVMTGDPRAFKQIVLNLVANAIKFTERGGTVTVSAAVEGSRLVLRVTDTGVGIAADDLKRIGDPFFQAGKTYQRRHEGTGLGLSIVKSLVGLHAGEMTVQSKLDEGTTVTVALPLAFTPRAEQPISNIATLTPAVRSATPEQSHQVKKSA